MKRYLVGSAQNDYPILLLYERLTPGQGTSTCPILPLTSYCRFTLTDAKEILGIKTKNYMRINYNSAPAAMCKGNGGKICSELGNSVVKYIS
jgi:hypothetical protein